MTALLLTSSSRAKSLMRIFSKIVSSFVLPVLSQYSVPCTQFCCHPERSPAEAGRSEESLCRPKSHFRNSKLVTSRPHAALRRAHGLQTSTTHLRGARFP